MRFDTKLRELKPVEPQRIRAKWIATTALQEGQITYRDYKCSNCSHHRGKPMNFCEVCGAKMER
jgi:rRNA maturation endonuclease Nob1